MALSYAARMRLSKQTSKWVIAVLRLILLAGISFVILYPLVTKALISLMPVRDVFDMSVKYIPKSFSLDNYKNAWSFLNISGLLFSSFLIPVLTALVQTISSTLVAYGFARFKFRFKNFWFALVILMIVVPPDLILFPQYLSFRFFDIGGINILGFKIPGLVELATGTTINLLDSPVPFLILGLTCTGLKNGLYIFILRQYFNGIPKELEEAAYVDGANTLTIFIKVFLSSASQMMITVFLFSFVWIWLDDLYSSAFMQNTSLFITELYRLTSVENGVDSGLGSTAAFSLMRNAGLMLLIIPMFLLYVFCQRYFTESIERSGLVG